MNVQEIITSFISLAYQMPLEIFVSVGLFLDEIILPVPAPIMLTIAGSISHTQNQTLFYLFILAVLGSVGKTLGMWFYYFLGERADHLLVPKYGKLLGITQQMIDKWSKKMKGGLRDIAFVFITRVIPFVPTIPVSFVCGMFQTNLKSFLITSFIATIIRNYFFLYLGFLGTNAQFLQSDHIEKVMLGIGMLFVVGYSVWYFGLKNRKH